MTSLGANQVKNSTSGEVCRWMSAEVSKLEKDLKANGVALIGIGPEETGVKEFKDGGFFKGDIYIDEKKQCYKDLGFKRQVQKEFTEIFCRGMLIVTKGGERVLLHFVQKTLADNVSLEDIALGISVNIQAGEKPQCNEDVCTR